MCEFEVCKLPFLRPSFGNPCETLPKTTLFSEQLPKNSRTRLGENYKNLRISIMFISLLQKFYCRLKRMTETST